MEEPNKSQLLKLFLVASLLIITPLLSTTHRSTYLYFIVNIVIIAVGAEAGLLSFFLNNTDNDKSLSPSTTSVNKKPNIIDNSESAVFSDHIIGKIFAEPGNQTNSSDPIPVKKPDHVVNGSSNKKRPSTNRSIFFIGEEPGPEVEDDDEAGEDVGELSGPELFQKSENFIGNFYTQLKMQREESWKKLQDLYQKTF